MIFLDWQHILDRLNEYPLKVHNVLPPCNKERLKATQSELGEMPKNFSQMLKHFNGGRFFNKIGPLVSIFGVSTIPPLPPLEWAPDWYIDKFTPKWRAVSAERKNDWAIAMMNYGGLMILRQDGMVREWDTARRQWDSNELDFGEWIEKILVEGEAYLKAE